MKPLSKRTDPPAWLVGARGPSGYGRPLWIIGDTNLYRGPVVGALIAAEIIRGAMDGQAFAAYVEQVLVPELEPGTVVILDNPATHKNVAAAKAMRKADCRFLLLPPYSPAPNPIEIACSNSNHIRAELSPETMPETSEVTTTSKRTAARSWHRSWRERR